MGENTITLIQFIVLGGVRCMVNNDSLVKSQHHPSTGSG